MIFDIVVSLLIVFYVIPFLFGLLGAMSGPSRPSRVEDYNHIADYTLAQHEAKIGAHINTASQQAGLNNHAYPGDNWIDDPRDI